MNVPNHIYIEGVLYIRARPVQLEAEYGRTMCTYPKGVDACLKRIAAWASPQPEPAVTHYDHLLTIAEKKGTP